MLNLKETMVTVFDLRDSEKAKNTRIANISSSTKKSDDTWENMSWYSKFVGDAFEKSKELNDKDRIKITKGAVENNYNKDQQKTYVRVIVFDFEKLEKTEQ